MAPLLEAFVIFVGLPALALSAIAAVVYTTFAAARRLAAPQRPLAAPIARPAQVVAFPGRRPVVVRTAEHEDVRRAA